MQTELTLADINNYLNTRSSFFPVGGPGVSCTTVKPNIKGDASYTITQVDDFLLNQIEKTNNSFNTSSTTKDNFLELYNEQYARNMETFIGILIISGILAKMIFYPNSIPKL